MVALAREQWRPPIRPQYPVELDSESVLPQGSAPYSVRDSSSFETDSIVRSDAALSHSAPKKSSTRPFQQPWSVSLKASPLPSSEPHVQRLADTAERVVRDHFTARVVAALEQLERSAGQATASPSAADLFFVIRDYAQQSPADPFVDVLMALHDSLAANDFWVKTSKDQYQLAIDILQRFSARRNLSENSIDSAINQLEEAGFDTTPFAVTL
jgi:hypothetical protein